MGRDWLPLSARENPERVGEFRTLYEGVPLHMQSSLTAWTARFFPTSSDSLLWMTFEELRRLERVLHVNYTALDEPRLTVGAFLAGLNADPVQFLNVVDALLSAHGEGSPEAVEDLDRILSESGSVWAVAERHDGWRLERRLGPEIEQVAALALTPDDNASLHLRNAWANAFSRNPNASSAYQELVRSLEATFQPIVSPKSEKATLGTIVRDIRDGQQKFAASLHGKGKGSEDVIAICDMLNVIWRTDVRHGSGLEGAPTGVTLEQARDAVVLAAALIQLVRQGGFRAITPT